MDWKIDHGDQGSEGNSLISLDRCSDDTDFLIGQNLSFHGNDSFLETKSSTTTDLIYQQELTDNDLQTAKHDSSLKTNLYSSGKYSPGSNSPPKTSYQYNYSHSSSSSAYKYTKTYDENLKKINDYKPGAKKTPEKPSKQSSAKPGIQSNERPSYQNSSKGESQKVQTGFTKADAETKVGNANMKYRSIHEKSNDESMISEQIVSEKKEQKTFSDSYKGYLSDYDSKVKEGEVLLAKLLGKINLNESGTSPKNEKRSMPGEKAITEKSRKEPPCLDRNSKIERETIGRAIERNQSKNSEVRKTEVSMDFRSNINKNSESFKSQINRNESNFDGHSSFETNNKMRSLTTSSDQSKNSRSDTNSLGSQDKFPMKNSTKEERLLNNYSFQRTSSGHNSSSTSIQAMKVHLDENTGNLLNSHKFGKSPKQNEHDSHQSKNSYNTEYSGSNDELRDVSQKSMEDKQIVLSESYNEWQIMKNDLKKELDRKSSQSSSERFLGKVNSETGEVQTSTPHKSVWPVSPIRHMIDSDIKESEAILANKERKLKSLRLEIEQEMIRKEAILQDKSSAEEALLQIRMNIQSLEQLGEEHKKQAIATRSELMSLEQQRNDSQRKLTEITEELNRQKKELESIPKELKESNISTKIALLQDERDELKRECKILREKCKDTDYLNTTNMDLMKKMRNLQEQLYNEQDESREKQRSVREELEKEKRKTVEASIEQLNVVKKLREEAMEAKKMEMSTFMERLEKEKAEEIEAIRTRYQREARSMQRRIEELEEDNQKTIESNRERLSKIQEMTEKNLKRETEIVMKKLTKEKEAELSLCTQRHKRETEELEIRINAKQSEIDTLQTLLRQQEDSTRLLGEKLRSEAKDQICMAVEKERNSRLEELRETELELEKVKEERDSIARGNSTELKNNEKENERLRNLVNKLKKELDDAKHENYEAREEKLQAISRTRLELKEDVDRLKGRIRELERIEQTVFLEINEECMKTTAVTENSYPQLKRNYDFEDVSPITEALNVLKIANNDLRKQLMTYKKRLDESRMSDECTEQHHNRSGSDSTCDKGHTPESLKLILNGSSEESKSARILKHLQSRVKQLRKGNQSMKKSFGSDEGETDLENTSGSSFLDQGEDASFSPKSSKIQNLENSLKRAEEQAQKYVNLLSQKMAENTKLQKMLTHASKENIKLERLHSVLQQKMASNGGK